MGIEEILVPMAMAMIDAEAADPNDVVQPGSLSLATLLNAITAQHGLEVSANAIVDCVAGWVCHEQVHGCQFAEAIHQRIHQFEAQDAEELANAPARGSA